MTLTLLPTPSTYLPFKAEDTDRPVGSPEWWLNHLAAKLDAKRWNMVLFDDYYRGRHRLPFVTARYQRQFANLLQNMRINFCRVTVEVLVERLEVQGLRLGKDQSGDEEAWRIWQANNLDAVMARGFRTALTKGECSAILWRNPEDERTPLIELHDPTEVIVARAGRRRLAALQRWYDEETQRLFATLYLPDRLYRFQSVQRSTEFSAPVWGWAPKVTWEQRTVPGENWPQANPWGIVPVIPLVNSPDLSGVGMSELDDVVPIQDAINKETWDQLVASEFGAFRQRWISGIDIPVNPTTGQAESPFEAGADNVWTVPPAPAGEEATRFGEFGETNITAFREVVRGHIQQWATIKRMPPHYLLGEVGNAPSGESLRAAEAGLVSSSRGHMRDLDDPIEEMLRVAFLIAGDTERAAIRDSEVIWRDPETHSESERIDALVKQRTLGIPDEILWEKAGYSPQEIQRIHTIQVQQQLELAASGSPQGGDVDLLVKRVDLWGGLIRGGATPESAAKTAGLDGLEHTGDAPVTTREAEAPTNGFG